MEWVVETVLPREVRRLASTIEKKDVEIALMNDDLQERDNQIQAIKYENVALQAQRDVYEAQLQRYQDIITHFRIHYVDHTRNPGKDSIQNLPMINFMTFYTISRGYNGVKGMLS